MLKRPVLDFIDYMRAFAILTIVAAHSLMFGNNAVLNLNAYLWYGSTVSFVFISGFLFRYLIYQFDYVRYLKRKFWNVFLPYFVVILPISVSYAFLGQGVYNTFESYSKIGKIFSTVIFGQTINTPMWYMGMVLIFFVAAPLFIYLLKRKVFFIAVMVCSFIYSMYVSRPPFLVFKGSVCNHFFVFSVVFIRYWFENFLWFLTFYMQGIWFCEFVRKHISRILCYRKKMLFVSLCAFVFFGLMHLIFDLDAFETLGLSKFLVLCVLFSLSFELSQKILPQSLTHKVLKMLASYSYGIFLIHEPILNLIRYHVPFFVYQGESFFDISGNDFVCFFRAVLSFVLALSGSLLVLFILKKILLKLHVKNTRLFIGV